MTTIPQDRVIRVLELRSVRGTGGGPEKTILFGAAKAAADVHVTVCYIRDRRDDTFGLDARARSLGVDYVEVYERHSLDRAIMPQLDRVIRERQIAIVHAHEYKTDLVALWLARRTGVVPLATAHWWTGHSPRERFVYYPVDKFLLARYPRVIAVSTDIKNELVRRGARADRVTVILNAIDPDAFTRSPLRQVAAGFSTRWCSGNCIRVAKAITSPSLRHVSPPNTVFRLTCRCTSSVPSRRSSSTSHSSSHDMKGAGG